jgi:hypothetical protein
MLLVKMSLHYLGENIVEERRMDGRENENAETPL